MNASLGLLRQPGSSLWQFHWMVVGILLAIIMAPLRADDQQIEFFEKRIRPVLVRHCYKCHATNIRSPKGGLLLDTRDGIRRGGDSGAAVVPGQPAESLLIEALRFESLEMPPSEKLPDAVIADFVHWIEMGAHDPRDAAAVTDDETGWQSLLAARRNIWSLKPLRRVDPPVTSGSGWSHQAVDQFILAALEESGLQPGPRADRHALIRRLSFAVTGLPPTPAEIQAFVNDPSPHAWERLVDRMLDSPHFGERWARHWMDVVRFTETHGHEWNFEVRGAWRYRDYLIRAFNQDVPYDAFIREHIAGDLLPEARWDKDRQVNESLTATAFYRFGEAGHDDCLEFRDISLEIVDNQIDTLTKAFQAMTVSCARCHDHKLDAVSMQDYYALSGILSSSRGVARTIDAPSVNDQINSELAELKLQIRRTLATQWIQDVRHAGEYLLAAQSSDSSGQETAAGDTGPDAVLEKWKTAFGSVATEPALEHPLYPWYRMMRQPSWESWQELADQYRGEQQRRLESNSTGYIPFGDFRRQDLVAEQPHWHVDGLGAMDTSGHSGEFSVLPDGERVIAALLPAGLYTHLLSNRLNGAIRSPILPKTQKFLSVQVLGAGDSGLRAIHDNCHLNVAFNALSSNQPKWITIPTAHEYPDSRSYAALVTRFNNQGYPKYNTQERVDPLNIRSFFGITRAVLHDRSEPPLDELNHLARLFTESAVASRQAVAAAYARVIQGAVSAWAADTATDADVRWVDWLLQSELLGNSISVNPRLAVLVTEYRQVESRIPPPKIVNGLQDLDAGIDVRLRIRGNAFDPGEHVPRRYLEVLAGSEEPLGTEGSGRRELAELIASPENPLTARVMANRIWHHLFGNGIVRTTDDFGAIGERPSHPELLDFLAGRFIEDGWSVKRLIRTLLLTQTFQMSSQNHPQAVRRDPENRLLHHFPLRRLDAESIRDAILCVSSRLDPTLYGESIDPWRTEERLDRRLFRGPLDGNGRRSVYLKFTLSEEPPFLTVFNLPEPKVSRGRRDVTTVPAQALALLNDPFVKQQAEFWAARIITESGSVPQRLDRMFMESLGRIPSAEERQRFSRLVDHLCSLREVSPEDVLTDQEIWSHIAHALFNVKEFIYVR